jgi:hypothetical protein
MVLNREWWIDKHLGERRPRLAMARMAPMKPARKTNPGETSGKGW